LASWSSRTRPATLPHAARLVALDDLADRHPLFEHLGYTEHRRKDVELGKIIHVANVLIVAYQRLKV
jgi:hypothetical protein